jgi:hypothetical protein
MMLPEASSGLERENRRERGSEQRGEVWGHDTKITLNVTKEII